MQRFALALLATVSGCRGATPQSAAATDATVAPPASVTASTSGVAPVGDASHGAVAWDEAACTGMGEFDLAAIWSNRACEVSGEGRDEAFDPAFAGAVAVSPAPLRASPAGVVTARVLFTNTRATPLVVIAFVLPEQPLALRVRRSPSEPWMPLAPTPPGGFTRTAPPSWFAKIRFAPKAVGRLVVTAKATTSLLEHLAAPPGQAAPWVHRDTPLAAGDYELQLTDMLRAKELTPKSPVRLVVAP